MRRDFSEIAVEMKSVWAVASLRANRNGNQTQGRFGDRDEVRRLTDSGENSQVGQIRMTTFWRRD